MTWEPEIQELERRRALALEMGGPDRVREQHERGKLSVRERIDALADPGSFRERGALAGSADYEDGELRAFRPSPFVMGLVRLDGRPAVVGGGDYTSRGRPASGGGGGQGGPTKTAQLYEIARDLKLPLVQLIDAFGADIRAIEAIGRTYIPANPHWEMVVDLMGEVPVVAAGLGAVAGLPAAQIAATHFSVMVKGVSQVFAAGPPVVQRALGHEITKEELGGAAVHAHGSGVVDNEAEDEADAFRQVRAFLSYLPSSIYEHPPVCSTDDPADRREEALLSLIPRDRNRPYNPRKMVELIVDGGSAFEMGRYYGRSLVTMFARLDGKPVGVLANDPMAAGGAMDAAAAQKFEKFVDLCDTFHLPVVNFVDQPGFMIGRAAEASGTLKQGVRALSALYQASIPWATVVVRRVYGVAGAGHQNHARFNFRVAWPSAEWGSLPIEGGVMAAYRRQIEAAEDPVAFREDLEQRLVAMRSPFRTAEAYNIEDIIDPRETRPMLCEWVNLAYRVVPTLLGPRARRMRP